MKQRVTVGLVVVVLGLVGWLAWAQVSDGGGGGSGGTRPAGTVVDRIGSETDCAVLQDEFDRAGGNGHTDYMRAADARMRAIGCYGP